MLNFIETILVKIFSLLPNGNPDSFVIASFNEGISYITPIFAKINLIFPIYVLFKVLLLMLLFEMSLFFFTLIMKVAVFFRG